MGTFDFRSLSELGDPEVERIGWGGVSSCVLEILKDLRDIWDGEGRLKPGGRRAEAPKRGQREL